MRRAYYERLYRKLEHENEEDTPIFRKIGATEMFVVLRAWSVEFELLFHKY